MTDKELISYFSADLFIPSLEAKNKNDAINEMVEHLVHANRLKDGKIARQLIKAREKLGSTGIGKGVAVPHGRTTVTNALTLLVARSEEGIEYDALDKKPVHLFFLILAPHQDRSNQYLPLLGKLVEITRSAPIRRKLLKSKDLDAFTAALVQKKAK